MCALLREPSENDENDEGRPRPTVLHIDGRPYVNTAAKFWPTLIDEVLEEYPSATAIELTAPAHSPLSRRFLDPASALSEALARLRNVDIHAAIASTLAELELLGGPASVMLRILAGDAELANRDLPIDCIDADILPYLVTWLLEWTGLPESKWNDEFLSGAFTAEDRPRRRTYRIDHGLRREHLSEGLHRWSLTIMPIVERFNGD